MSRTIRRMPFNGGTRMKWFASTFPRTKPDYAGIRIHHYRPVTYSSSLLQTLLENQIDESIYDIIRYENGRFSVILKEMISIKDKYEDKDKEFENEIMFYAIKNNTCKRHRRNGVRISKRLDHKEQRTRLKTALRKELTTIEQETPDPAPRWTISKRRQAKTLLRQKSKYDRKAYKRALQKSSAKTFDDLYVNNQSTWFRDSM